MYIGSNPSGSNSSKVDILKRIYSLLMQQLHDIMHAKCAFSTVNLGTI